jgi:exodeoxyribonuclease VII large subunit
MAMAWICHPDLGEKPWKRLTAKWNASILCSVEQPALFDPSRPWTVTDLTRYLRQLLESDGQLQGIWVQGEVSNLARPASGHLYFTLKDAGAALRCVVWKSAAARLRFQPEDGMAIEVHGSLSVYEAGGQYQLYADSLRPAGEGALYQEYLRLKDKLEAEGLFDPTRRRPIPAWPHRIGIVTSPSGAALHDMLNTIRRRFPLVEVILAASPVQGDEAPLALIEGLRALNRIAAPDVILLARGGGSIEDLWAFNDEHLVRAIRESAAPVITGIGHETDFTLADFAADLQAPTPTAAAELATPLTVLGLRASVAELSHKSSRWMVQLFEEQRTLLGGEQDRLGLASPQRRVQTERQRLDERGRRASAALGHCLEIASERLKGLDNRLRSLSPSAVLNRGYSIVTRRLDGRLVSRVLQVQKGDELKVRVQDGEFESRVSGDE